VSNSQQISPRFWYHFADKINEPIKIVGIYSILIWKKKQELNDCDETSVKFIIVRQNPCHTVETFVIQKFMFCAPLIYFKKRMTSYLQFNWKGKDKFSLRMPNTASKLSIQYVIHYLPKKVHQGPGKSLETIILSFFSYGPHAKLFFLMQFYPCWSYKQFSLFLQRMPLQSGPNYTLNLFNLF